MPTFLLGLLKYLPFLGGFFEKWTENKSRAAELRAQKELVEAKAFAKGRIAPKYLLHYAVVAVFCFFSVAMIWAAFFGGDTASSKDGMGWLIRQGVELLHTVEW